MERQVRYFTCTDSFLRRTATTVRELRDYWSYLQVLCPQESFWWQQTLSQLCESTHTKRKRILSKCFTSAASPPSSGKHLTLMYSWTWIGLIKSAECHSQSNDNRLCSWIKPTWQKRFCNTRVNTTQAHSVHLITALYYPKAQEEQGRSTLRNAL